LSPSAAGSASNTSFLVATASPLTICTLYSFPSSPTISTKSSPKLSAPFKYLALTTLFCPSKTKGINYSPVRLVDCVN
jgi:hypothetical protein